ncbi:hypothetical protein TWF481_005047 [Arthrobotrys musiformis]|uniref:Uncharacterized protein n=1 Tax=Arthrobotrys musiformis TaxID=47236 RepID=A0AAV9WEJ1_9PEZI
MRSFSTLAVIHGAAMAALARAPPAPTEHHLAKRMISHTLADYFGGFLRVMQPEISGWTTEHGSELTYYLKFSKEVRDKLADLKTEPYVPLLRAYARDYLREIFPDDPFAFISWQEFIDEDLLTALQRPWEQKWKMPSFTLSPADRTKGLSSELKEVYPRAEIENEEAFDNRPLLESTEISTVEYLTQFSLPFPNISSLTTWFLNPVTLPAASGEAQDDALYIELDRRERIEDSLKAIRVQLGTIIEGIQGFDLQTQFAGKIPIQPAFAQPIIDAIQTTVDDWERVKDVVSVMSSIMELLKKDLQ